MTKRINADRGEAYRFRLDALSLDRMKYAQVFAKECLDLNVSASTIIRAALERYIQHLEDAMKRYREEQESYLLSYEGQRLKRAGQGDTVKWEGGRMPTHFDDGFPTFRELVAKHQKNPFAFLDKPMGSGRDDD